MIHKNINQVLRLFISIVCLEILCVTSIQSQNFVQYSNPEIESKEIYATGNPYQKDFLLFIDLLCKTHPAFASESTYPFDFNATIQAGYHKADSCHSTKDLWCHMQQVASLLNDGHTTLMPAIDMSMVYPIILFFDNSDVLVRGINEEYRINLGKKIAQVNGYSWGKIYAAFKAITSSDNDSYFKDKLINFFQLYSMWAYTSCCSPDSVLHISFTDGTNASISPVGKDKIKMVMADSIVQSKTIRKNNRNPFQYTILSEEKICYFQFNSCIDQSSVRAQYLARFPDIAIGKLDSLVSRYPRFDMFLDEMFENMQRNSVGTLVVDVRNNSGGDSRLCDMLLSRLKDTSKIRPIRSYTRFSELWQLQYPAVALAYQKRLAALHQPFKMGELYDNYTNSLIHIEDTTEIHSLNRKKENIVFDGKVIFVQNSKTYSSAGMLITLAQDNAIGTIIGEQSSYKPCTYGDILAWQLPNTKIKGYVSHKIFMRPNVDQCEQGDLKPTVLLCPNWEDILQGKDMCWEWILRHYK